MKNRIYFKKFMSEDDFKYYLKLVSNKEVMTMNGKLLTLEQAKMIYKHSLTKNKMNNDFGNFMVFEKISNTFIGSGAIFANDDFTEAEIEYLLLPEYWGKRYGSEIVENLLKIADKTKSIQKVTAITNPNNIRSKKILLNHGFVSVKIYKVPEDSSLAELFSKKNI